MAIEWLAGNRLRGTTAERPSASLQSPSVGGWVELARTTLSSNTEVVVSSLPDKRYYMVLQNGVGGGVTANNNKLRFNSDSGANYARRSSLNGASDSTSASNDAINTMVGGDHDIDEEFFNVTYVANLTAKEKLVQSHYVHQLAAGAGTAPGRGETVAKWANTSAAINSMRSVETYPSGSEWVVLGWDPSDSHTTNFWEELASVELGSAVTNLSSGTISAKKYLWCQVFTKSSSGTIPLNMTFNNDTGNNYAQRRSIDGSSDSTNASRANIQLQADTAADVKFNNIFIINNSSNEKLVIHHSAESQASGAATAPVRRETVGKWANTSSQITEIDIDSTSGNYDTGSILKVWGAD